MHNLAQTTKFPEYVDAYDGLPNSLMRYEGAGGSCNSCVTDNSGREEHLRAHECAHGSCQGRCVSIFCHVRYVQADSLDWLCRPPLPKMSEYGGVYADLDFELLHPLGEIDGAHVC